MMTQMLQLTSVSRKISEKTVLCLIKSEQSRETLFLMTTPPSSRLTTTATRTTSLNFRLSAFDELGATDSSRSWDFWSRSFFFFHFSFLDPNYLSPATRKLVVLFSSNSCFQLTIFYFLHTLVEPLAHMLWMYTAQLRVYPPEHISSLFTEPTFAPSQMYANDKWLTLSTSMTDGEVSERISRSLRRLLVWGYHFRARIELCAYFCRVVLDIHLFIFKNKCDATHGEKLVPHRFK